MSLVIRQYAFGGADTLTAEQEDVAEPGPGQVRLHQRAIGVNFIDLAFRAGALGGHGFPLTIGLEAAGVVEAVGAEVTGLAVGDRVSYTSAPGANAERRLIDASTLINLPDSISYVTAAATTAKGLTAGALISVAHPVSENDVILVHAAAGGVGSLLTRWAKAKGATVIGTVGSPAKVAAATANGADHVLTLGSTTDVLAEIDRITAGRGVSAVYDGVGADTIDLSLRAVAEGGTVVSFGGSSGPAALDDDLITRRRIAVSQPSLDSLAPSQAARQSLADELFSLVASGDLGELPITTYALPDVGRAHRDLESRQSTGALVLTV